MIPFVERVDSALRNARAKHGKIASAHEGYAVILEELDEFKAEVWKKREARSAVQMLIELSHTAAMCQRVAEDLDLIDPELPS